MSELDNGRLHDRIHALGIRAQASAIGLVQLSLELRRAGVIDDAAVDRIKDAIADELSYSRPASAMKAAYTADVRARLDRLFAGIEPVGQIQAEPSDRVAEEE